MKHKQILKFSINKMSQQFWQEGDQSLLGFDKLKKKETKPKYGDGDFIEYNLI